MRLIINGKTIGKANIEIKTMKDLILWKKLNEILQREDIWEKIFDFEEKIFFHNILHECEPLDYSFLK